MAEEPTPPPTRKVIVDCTVALEVTVQYDPLSEYDGKIIDVSPDWQKFQVGLAYWQPTERMTNVGVRWAIVNHIEHTLPRYLELRFRPPEQEH